MEVTLSMTLCPLDYRYGRAQMKAIFDESSRLEKQMRVEAALAKAHAAVGNISEEDAAEISAKSTLEFIKLDRVKEIEQDTRHDVMAMVKAITEQCGEAGRYVHLGATSNDIVDTATALQIGEALNLVQDDVDRLIQVFIDLAKEHRGTVEIGRTHAQFAIPITFGFKIAGYLDEMLRHRERLMQIRPRVLVGKMAGAVGTGAALGDDFLEIQELVMQDLGLTPEGAATQVVCRDRYTELILSMAAIATSCERYATEVRNLQRSELSEASESFDSAKQVGSSTMAHKRNPITSENVCGLARVVRGFIFPTLESQVLWHERDLTNSSTERFTVPHVFALVDEILLKMVDVFGNLAVHNERMMFNLESSQGLIMAEPVMMALVEKGMGRQDAHELVRSCSMVARDGGLHLRDVLRTDPVVSSLFDAGEIETVMDPTNYVGKAPEMTDMVVERAESALGIRKS